VEGRRGEVGAKVLYDHVGSNRGGVPTPGSNHDKVYPLRYYLNISFWKGVIM